MSAEFPYPNRQPDELGFVNKYVIIAREECFRILKKELPTEQGEAEFLCQHFSARVIEVGNGVIFKPYDK